MMNDEPHYEMYTIAAIRRKAHICENEKKKKTRWINWSV